MSPSLKILMSGAIDYAGLFPPAKLDLNQAISNYIRYRSEPESWMLGRFICPAKQLAELVPLAAELRQAQLPLMFSALGRGGSNTKEFLDGLKADLDALDVFRREMGESVVTDVFETRLPEDAVRQKSPEALATLIHAAADYIESRQAAMTPYFEAGISNDWKDTLAAAIRGLAEVRKQYLTRASKFCGPPGFKLRCGGVEAAAFPPPEVVAFTLVACRDEKVPLKFTAGLHHPIRHYDRSLQTHMHGFVNVLVAGVLAYARKLGEDNVREILVDESAGDFAFDTDALRCKQYKADAEEIVAARLRAVKSFGSCSFDEPREDLRSLGLL